MDWNELMKNKVFITDIGESKTAVIDEVETVVGRYAVWSPMRNSDSHQVIEVGDSLPALMEKYHVPADRICALR